MAADDERDRDADRSTFPEHVQVGQILRIEAQLLEQANAPAKCDRWGFPELRAEVIQLPEDDLAYLLGRAPTSRDMQLLRFEDLRVVLISLAAKAPGVEPGLRPVPAGKIAADALSKDVETLLEAGMRKADLVSEFFRQWDELRFGDEVAAAFRAEYVRLRACRLAADHLFTQLVSFAGGAERGSPQHEGAVYAVLAHLFEECDIFERPPLQVQG